MKTSDKISQSRGYVSPSYSSDISPNAPESLLNNAGALLGPTALMASKWLFKRYPKVLAAGALEAVALVGYKMLNKKNDDSILSHLRNLH
jgi:uncharacterized membrane protein YebE (DUF533 family)